MDGYELDDRDNVSARSINASTLSTEEIYELLGLGELDDEE